MSLWERIKHVFETNKNSVYHGNFINSNQSICQVFSNCHLFLLKFDPFDFEYHNYSLHQRGGWQISGQEVQRFEKSGLKSQ